jgi:uncharacterized damage-inducible protein DinB
MTEAVRPAAKWFERKFEFTFPLEQYPNLCMRLRGTPPRMEELLGDLLRETLVRKADEKWSIQEHAGHLLDLEALWKTRVEDFIAGSKQLTAADLSNRMTNQADHNASEVSEILKRFRKERLQLLELLEKIDPNTLGRTLLHPRLQQPMRLVDHLVFVAEHDDHHLVRMWELAKK